MSERKTLCDLGMVTVDFGGSDAETPELGNTFKNDGVCNLELTVDWAMEAGCMTNMRKV